MKRTIVLGRASAFAMACGAIIARQYITQQMAKREEEEFAAFIKAKEDAGEIPAAPRDEEPGSVSEFAMDPSDDDLIAAGLSEFTEGELDEMVAHPCNPAPIFGVSPLASVISESLAMSEVRKWTDVDVAKLRAQIDHIMTSDKPGKVLTPGALVAMEKAEQRRARRRERNLRLASRHAPI